MCISECFDEWGEFVASTVIDPGGTPWRGDVCFGAVRLPHRHASGPPTRTDGAYTHAAKHYDYGCSIQKAGGIRKSDE